MSEPLTLPCLGDVVDERFRIECKLGEGGTSTIYGVRHVITDKPFVIKWLSPELAQNELAVQRFIHEARVCGRFKHPNAIEIYDIVRADESYYLLMELLEGESLEARLERVGQLSVQDACDILLPCTEALGAAHRVGIVHRDLKPSNIFLCRVEGRQDEVPKVLDFGISKLNGSGLEFAPFTTTTRTVIGTPLYMSPEQMRGHPPEPSFDIYALGVVLYELVAGQPPFECDTFADLVFKIIEAQPARLDQVADVEAEFADIVARSMARNVEDRFATMADFAAALRPYSSQPGAALAAKVSAAPIVLPAAIPEPAPVASVETPLPIVRDEPDEPDELFRRPARRNNLRWAGVSIAVGFALAIAWHTSARDPRAKVEAPQPPIEKAPSPEPAVARNPALDLFGANDGTSPSVQAQPPHERASESAKHADPGRAKAVRRSTHAKTAEVAPSSQARTNPAPRQVPASEPRVRHDSSDSDDGIAIPEANLSKHDF